MLLVIFGVFLAAGRFDLHSGGRTGNLRSAVITRRDSPMIYWGVESSILVMGLMVLSHGIARSRKGTGSGSRPAD
jgi:hypothetical protein